MWLRVLAFVALLLLPAPSWAALAVDAAASCAGTGVSSLTCAHTVSGADRELVNWISWYHSTSTLSGSAYNGVALTAIPSGSAANGQYHIDGLHLIAPATGTNNLVATFSGSVFDVGMGSVSFTGADQTNPLGTAVTATGTSTTPSVTVSSAAGEIVIDGLVIVHGGTLTVGGSQTQQWNSIASGGYIKYAGSTQNGAASTTNTWTNSTSQVWAQGAVPVKPVAVASSAPMRALLGVGK